MEFYYLFLFLILGIAHSRNINNGIITDSNENDENFNKVEEDNDPEKWGVDPKSLVKFAEKCRQVGGEIAEKKLYVAVEKTITCLNNEIPKNQQNLQSEFGTEIIDNLENVCSKRQKIFHDCFVDAVDALKDCSSKEEKYIPNFIFTAVDGFLNLVCTDNGKVVNDVMSSEETHQCFEYLIEKVFAGEVIDVCTENVKLLYHNENVITKADLCTDLQTAKSCYSEFLTRECPAATALNDLLVGAFNAVSTPCKDIPIFSNLLETNTTLPGI